MKRKTKDLPLIKRWLARKIHNLQKKLIWKEDVVSFKIYYLLSKIHFRLHYGFSLSAALISQDLKIKKAGELAIRRHIRLAKDMPIMKAALKENNHDVIMKIVGETFTNNVLGR